MKKLFWIITAFMAFESQAAKVHSATYNELSNTVSLNVSYGGGCMAHDFELDFSKVCLESYPGQTSAVLVDSGANDPCEAYFNHDIELPVASISCAPAYLTIKGDGNSKVTVLVGTP